MTSIGPCEPRRVAVGMGSNLGDSWTILRQACAAFGNLPDTQLEGVSRVRRTQPIGTRPGGEQMSFLNAVALLRTSLAPVSLLAGLMTIEQDFGRLRIHRWMPRTLDLDILLDEAGPFCAEGLFIPHPRLASRLFFLACLEDLLPNWRHPWCGLTVSELVKILRDRPPYFLIVSETFTRSLPPLDAGNQLDEARKNSDAVALMRVLRPGNERIDQGCNPSESTAWRNSTQISKRRAIGPFDAEDIAFFLGQGHPVLQLGCWDSLKTHIQQREQTNFPQPRVIIVGPKAKDLLWNLPPSVTPSLPTSWSLKECSPGSLLSQCATPVVFVECEDAAAWAMHIFAAADASAESGRVLGDLLN
ncbi:MAG: 2-amino-4-hydroxy-6-hydroxymethyldihydropteridine diphosphokinase [Thermogutta sp.]